MGKQKKRQRGRHTLEYNRRQRVKPGQGEAQEREKRYERSEGGEVRMKTRGGERVDTMEERRRKVSVTERR